MTNEKQSKSDEKIRKLNERCAENQAEVTQLNKEIKQLDKEIKQLFKENSEQLKVTREQIGELGNKFADYTEAMARPSIRRILEERFGADFHGSIRLRDTKDELDLEVDAWGVSRNGTGAAYIVEVKSKFRDEHIEQVRQLVERFRIHYSDYCKRAVYPMLAVVDISEGDRRKVWNAGIHLIEINDGAFQYANPPQYFEANGYHGMSGVRKDVPHLRAVPGRAQKRRGTG